jgi:hypothetical protein
LLFVDVVVEGAFFVVFVVLLTNLEISSDDGDDEDDDVVSLFRVAARDVERVGVPDAATFVLVTFFDVNDVASTGVCGDVGVVILRLLPLL